MLKLRSVSRTRKPSRLGPSLSPVFFLFCLSFSFSACVDGDEGLDPAATMQQGEIAAAKADCDDKSFCTREYLPTTCTFKGQSFESSNPCEAMKLARLYACDKKLDFSKEAVTCKASKSDQAEQ